MDGVEPDSKVESGLRRGIFRQPVLAADGADSGEVFASMTGTACRCSCHTSGSAHRARRTAALAFSVFRFDLRDYLSVNSARSRSVPVSLLACALTNSI